MKTNSKRRKSLHLKLIFLLPIIVFNLFTCAAQEEGNKSLNKTLNHKKIIAKDHVLNVLLFGKDTDGTLMLSEISFERGYTIQEHFHKQHSEVFYVQQGHIEFKLDDQTHDLHSGDCIFIPELSAHSAIARSSGKVLFITHPGNMDIPVNLLIEKLRSDKNNKAHHPKITPQDLDTYYIKN